MQTSHRSRPPAPRADALTTMLRGGGRYIIGKFGVTLSVDVTLPGVVTLSGVTGHSFKFYFGISAQKRQEFSKQPRFVAQHMLPAPPVSIVMIAACHEWLRSIEITLSLYFSSLLTSWGRREATVNSYTWRVITER